MTLLSIQFAANLASKKYEIKTTFIQKSKHSNLNRGLKKHTKRLVQGLNRLTTKNKLQNKTLLQFEEKPSFILYKIEMSKSHKEIQKTIVLI